MDYKLSAGKSRLVLLAVHPYLIHAYWEITPEGFDQAKEEAEAQEVLRFYKLRRIVAEDALPDYFDVEIDLQSRNWYVHLWSAEESYFADLALKRKDGTLILLVRSQVVHMPRPHPAIAIDQRFMKVESTERRAEIVPPPPVEREPPLEIVVSSVNDRIEPTPISKPADSEEIVMEEIDPVYTLHEGQGDRSEPDNTGVAETSAAFTGIRDFDLAAMAERNLTAGLSSASPQRGWPDGAPAGQP